MLIRVGFDLRLNFPEPTPLMLLLDVHPSLRKLITLEQPLAVPGSSISVGTDFYGNRMQRFVAPAGDVELAYRALIKNAGQPDAVSLDAEEIAVAQLPDDSLHYLSGSRYCETDQLTELAWQLFGQTGLDARSSHLRFRARAAAIQLSERVSLAHCVWCL